MNNKQAISIVHIWLQLIYCMFGDTDITAMLFKMCKQRFSSQLFHKTTIGKWEEFMVVTKLVWNCKILYCFANSFLWTPATQAMVLRYAVLNQKRIDELWTYSKAHNLVQFPAQLRKKKAFNTVIFQ